MARLFEVDLEKQDLIFSSAHFITFGNNICESLHGHNYRVRAKVTGTLNEHGYVTDFILLQRILKDIVRKLDHKMLLPRLHPNINVSEQGDELTVRFENRRWVFPTDNCALLPVDNTTAERIAEYIAESLVQHSDFQTNNLQRLQVAVDENEGQWGVFTRDLDR
ncbi:MAG TPA: 6-pyruvoyl tetrahydropterin synthase family protein [Pirellulaceae bacterium]|nr:6-pyruvoyl tetrahydropterin synthase family protein [Pirellulaceae bacterium]HMO93868.1 6-pyruvoyl tetrahydropterin synthase family protein [Pirellulaceae bacterium]HMP71128.1 6-pyruvoyl tetrahydropterin synthase family protein [Pirellulaceae bacterium]